MLGHPQLWPLFTHLSIPKAVLPALVARLDLVHTPAESLESLAWDVSRAQVTLAREQLETLRAGIAGPRGAPTRQQTALLKLLAAAGDESVRDLTRRWLTQKTRARAALEILADWWPEDLADYGGPVPLASHHVTMVANGPDRVGVPERSRVDV